MKIKLTGRDGHCGGRISAVVDVSFRIYISGGEVDGCLTYAMDLMLEKLPVLSVHLYSAPVE